MWTTILTILSMLASLWQKHKSPEVELARLKEQQKAKEQVDQLKAEHLKEDYARFKKIDPTDKDILDTLNKPL